ncbi:GlsB/YeaQ/YmgE family stress response membrane protein [Xanthomonadaceae bacterium JHOS43]|nr:GlsB/YeaQ/YmgE family stress response membrane protein [Xanthomonadaceae bacterium JHOS43]MCX7564310.1 GlsB/YeaQ/YmgE family stress response membrane protein [Xanthomonadaceae bacterium XH05]
MNLTLESLIILLLVGGIAGWLAGLVMKGRGFGILGNIVVGIVGAFVGTFVLGLFNVAIGGSILAAIINAFIGAVILLFLIGLIRKAA